MLYHDNAPAHKSPICQPKSEELGLEIMVDSPTFPTMLQELRSWRFQSDLELNNAVMIILNRLSEKCFSEVYDK